MGQTDKMWIPDKLDIIVMDKKEKKVVVIDVKTPTTGAVMG